MEHAKVSTAVRQYVLTTCERLKSTHMDIGKTSDVILVDNGVHVYVVNNYFHSKTVRNAYSQNFNPYNLTNSDIRSGRFKTACISGTDISSNGAHYISDITLNLMACFRSGELGISTRFEKQKCTLFSGRQNNSFLGQLGQRLSTGMYEQMLLVQDTAE